MARIMWIALLLPLAQANAKSPDWPRGIEAFQKSSGNCVTAELSPKAPHPAELPKSEETCRTEKLRSKLEKAPESLCPGVEAASIDVCFDRVLGSMIDNRLVGSKSVSMLARAPLLWWFGRENADSVASASKLIDIDRAALRNYERVAPPEKASADEKLFPHFILHHWQEQLDHARALGGPAPRDEFKKEAARWNFAGH